MHTQIMNECDKKVHHFHSQIQSETIRMMQVEKKKHDKVNGIVFSSTKTNPATTITTHEKREK